MSESVSKILASKAETRQELRKIKRMYAKLNPKEKEKYLWGGMFK
jgi:hypothetical protein